MSFRIIEVITENEVSDNLWKSLKQIERVDLWKTRDEGTGITKLSVLAPIEKNSEILEKIQTHMGIRENTRIVILPVEGTFPVMGLDDQAKDNGAGARKVNLKEEKPLFFKRGISKEELYYDVVTSIGLDANFIALVLLSTLVATIGILENKLAITIGAMLIAPLLAPNLALALATTLGDFKLMFRAIKINLVGIGSAILFSFIIGSIWRYGFGGAGFLVYSDIGYDSIVLALASGVAAVLSLVSGLSSILVGVMVAVALLPPAATIGIMLSVGSYPQAAMATLLLAINIVCINLSANVIFLLLGIQPSRWFEKQKAKRIKFWLILFWITMLLLVGGVIKIWHVLPSIN